MASEGIAAHALSRLSNGHQSLLEEATTLSHCLELYTYFHTFCTLYMSTFAVSHVCILYVSRAGWLIWIVSGWPHSQSRSAWNSSHYNTNTMRNPWC